MLSGKLRSGKLLLRELRPSELRSWAERSRVWLLGEWFSAWTSGTGLHRARLHGAGLSRARLAAAGEASPVVTAAVRSSFVARASVRPCAVRRGRIRPTRRRTARPHAAVLAGALLITALLADPLLAATLMAATLMAGALLTATLMTDALQADALLAAAVLAGALLPAAELPIGRRRAAWCPAAGELARMARLRLPGSVRLGRRHALRAASHRALHPGTGGGHARPARSRGIAATVTRPRPPGGLASEAGPASEA